MAAPTFGTAVNLAEGTGTRSLPAVTIAAGGYVVVQVIGEDGVLANVTPSHASLTFTKQVDAGASGDTRVQTWTAPDATGGPRTITVTPSNGARNYRVIATPVAGSDGPGGFASSITGQAVSLTRTGANSAIFMQVGDWNTGAVGSPTWTPGGATTLSQQGAAATYIFGRWDDSGATATASHGITSPSYTTPSIAVLEMLGTAGGGSTVAPDGIAVPVALGSPSAAWSGSVSPDGIAAPVALGSPTAVAQSTAAPDGIAVPLALGDPTVTWSGSIAPDGISVPVALGDPIVGAASVNPDGVAVPVALGDPTLVWSATVAPDGISVPVALGAPIVGAASVNPDGGTVPVTLGDPSLSWTGSVSPDGISVPVALGSPIIGAAPIAPDGIAVPVALGAPSLAWSGTVSPDGITVPVAIGAPTLNIPGAVISRPDTGTTGRPATGTITRPDTGTVVHILTVVVRLYTGTVSRP